LPGRSNRGDNALLDAKEHPNMTESDIPATPVTPTVPGGVGAPDHEVVYYEGRPLLRADQAKAALWLIIGIVLVALPVLAHMFDWDWWRPWMTLVAVIAAILAFVLPWLVMRTTRYRITSYRIDFERGLLTKKIDTLELWHVEDIKFEQGLLDRMMNVGSITVMSNDRTNPKLELHGVPDPRKIFDALKERVIAVKRQRGVIKMDMGT
jgi:membrane protein YdbS with pleckstrin-like domain